MAKPLCKCKQLLKAEPDRYASKVDHARFLCERCGRVANKKKHLCEATRLSTKP